jgi:hypothetical protein
VSVHPKYSDRDQLLLAEAEELRRAMGFKCSERSLTLL